MAIESPPWALQSGSFNAEQTRRAVFSWAARTSANSPGIVSGGIYSASDCQLSAPASGLSVQISPGEMLIPGNEGGAQGPGYGRVTSTSSVSISAADPSLPRVDLICATMSDAQYAEPTGGSGSQWALQVVTGTPTSGATLANGLGVATLPGSSLLLAWVLVPAAASNIVTADIANKATVVVPQTARMATLGVSSLGSGSTTSTSYVNLSSTRATATVNVGTAGIVLVCLQGQLTSSLTGHNVYLGVNITGANTVAPNGGGGLLAQPYAATAPIQMGTVVPYTGLAPGSTTFEAQLASDNTSATASASNVAVVAIPIA